MPTYQVIKKFIYRASTVDIEMGKDAHGFPIVVRQNGPMRRVEVGELIEDLRPEELVGMYDRVALVPDEHVEHLRALAADPTFRPDAGVYEPMSGPGDRVQKPPLTPAQAVALKTAEAELQAADNAMATEQRALDQKKQETRAKAFETGQEKARQSLRNVADPERQPVMHDKPEAAAPAQATEEDRAAQAATAEEARRHAAHAQSQTQPHPQAPSAEQAARQGRPPAPAERK